MSPLDDYASTWDPAQLRVQPNAAIPLHGVKGKGRRASPIRGKFIAGPIDVSWVCQAAQLGRTALLVGLALWHLRGLRRTESFIVSNLMLKDWGVQPDAKRRSLLKLESAGLITVQRQGKRSPQVTLKRTNKARAEDAHNSATLAK
jgi:DNA-binding transcriptional ArsR family regulator